jgi:hypothetical protein
MYFYELLKAVYFRTQLELVSNFYFFDSGNSITDLKRQSLLRPSLKTLKVSGEMGKKSS